MALSFQSQNSVLRPQPYSKVRFAGTRQAVHLRNRRFNRRHAEAGHLSAGNDSVGLSLMRPLIASNKILSNMARALLDLLEI
jgi:hypothetical protein